MPRSEPEQVGAVPERRESAWNDSYERLENMVFWPAEEVVRFLSRHVRRRVGPQDFVDLMEFPETAGHPPRILDLGCGIGRHVLLAHQFKFEGYGIDISRVAVDKAREWLAEVAPAVATNVVVGDVSSLPWPQQFFAATLSHGVLDSIPFSVARAAATDVHRVLADDCWFYCDLAAFDPRISETPIAAEIEVDEGFEQGTIQSFFDDAKLAALFDGLFDRAEQTLITHRSYPLGRSVGRWHLVLRKRSVGGSG